MRKRSSVYPYLLCALFAALTAVCSQIIVPLPFTPVPINLAYLAVLVCGGVLGAKKGAVAMAVYILLGAVGAPVFAGLSGGLGVLAGPTGGYIIGYLPMAAVMGFLAGKNTAARDKKTAKNIGLTILKGLPAVALGYAFGTAWFMVYSGTGLLTALLMCVVPFVPGDVLKIVAAGAICEALRIPMRSMQGSFRDV